MKSNIIGKASIDIDASAQQVWEALTTPALIRQYFFGTTAVSDWKEGSALIFKGNWHGNIYEDHGIILKVIPDKLFKYNYWSSMSGMEDKPENYVDITYELSEKEGVTIVTVTQNNIPDEKMKEHSQQNWQNVLKGLKELLEKEHAHS